MERMDGFREGMVPFTIVCAFKKEDSVYYMENGLEPDKTDSCRTSYEALAGERKYSDLVLSSCIG